MRVDFADAPRAIQNIADELSAYKQKVKVVTHQHTSDERLIASQNERLHHLTEQLKEANNIIEAKDLRSLSTLREELDCLRAQTAEQDKARSNDIKNLEMVSRNASIEAQKLRAKVNEVQADRSKLLDQINQLEQAIKVCLILSKSEITH